MRAYGLVALAIFGAASSLSGCGAANPSQSQDDHAATAPPATSAAGATVELTSEQLRSVRIEAIGARSFPVQFEAVGSVSFEEDPGIVQAESAFLTAQATHDAAQRELARVQDLGETHGIARKELESARAADLSAAAAVRAAREAVRALGVSEGEVETLVRSGTFTASGRADGHAWILVNVSESDTAKVHVGARVRVSVPAFPDDGFAGRVSRVYATLDPVSHRMALRAQVTDPHRKLRPGMLANVEIEYGNPFEGVAIPTTAAVREPDGRMVAWTTTDRSHFLSRELTLGREHDGHYEVLSGLKSGELVVTEGGVFLSNLLEAPPSD